MKIHSSGFTVILMILISLRDDEKNNLIAVNGGIGTLAELQRCMLISAVSIFYPCSSRSSL